MPGLSFPTFPSVPSMAEEAQDFVYDMLRDARANAESAVQQALDSIEELKDATFPSDTPAVPSLPVITTSFSSQLGMEISDEPSLGEINASTPTPFIPDDITVPDISSEIPEYASLIQGLTIPEPPTPAAVLLPAAPTIDDDLQIPDAPVANYGDVPDLYEFTLPDYVAPTLTAFDGQPPTFDVAPPSGAIDWAEPSYDAWIADRLKVVLEEMLDGGTGIAVNVERAIWERDRGRTEIAALADIQAAEDEYSSRGFSMPGNAVMAKIRDIRDKARAEVNKQSRDVAIKQADLEQTNRQFAVKTGAELENMFVQIFLSVTQRSFDIAKLAVESQIQIFNAQVSAFDVENKVFAARIDKFKADLQFALAQIDAYKAQLQAEAVKGELNKSRVEAFKAKVDAFQAQAQAYRAVVEAATARSELQKNKVDLYRAQIEGAKLRIEAKKGEYDAYESRIKGETAKASLEESNARAFSARVQAISAKSEIAVKQAEAELRTSEQKLKAYLGNLDYLGQLASRQLQAIQARAATLEAAYRRDATKFEVTKAGKQLEIQAQIETGRNLVAYYGAQVEMWKADVVRLTEYSKINSAGITAAGQIAATLAAGALAGTSVSAAFGGNVSRGENTSQSETYSESKSESTSTNSSNATSTSTNTNINIEG